METFTFRNLQQMVLWPSSGIRTAIRLPVACVSAHGLDICSKYGWRFSDMSLYDEIHIEGAGPVFDRVDNARSIGDHARAVCPFKVLEYVTQCDPPKL